MKRTILVASLAMCLAAPAHAVGPLGTILIGYVKQAIKEKVVAYAKEQVTGVVGQSLAGMPGAGMLAMMPGMAGMAGMAGIALQPGIPAEAMAAMQAIGFSDTNAKPLTDAEWGEYEQTMTMLGKASGTEDELPDVQQLRGMLTGMPQLSGMLRMQLQQFQEMKAEQARMREAYAQMSEPERQEVVAELAKSFREQPPEDGPSAMTLLKSDMLGLPEDLTQRLMIALKD